ncbi:hypothetical protein [Lactiplantibacillus plantarum]|uniref:hypothetical protein n=1 Tax=Lactiplantibacillus plantarum TaxID=1590 RepID=UPI0009774361|nr:hypothetical protein [Lactiplantibacillus plantarum]MBS0937354.1 phage replication protein [Lactiplantibacillus plantarum]MBS0945419.1 phage replication protein [Lactiplantibacillus plantarum]
MKQLTNKQTKLIEAMLTEPTFEASYRKAGVSKATALKYRREPSFKQAYHEAKRQVMEQVTTKLQEKATEAVNVLNEIMNDKEAPASSRIQSARIIIDTAYKGVELDDLAERIDELETAIDKQKEGQS